MRNAFINDVDKTISRSFQERAELGAADAADTEEK
jgi:hypothetical protein